MTIVGNNKVFSDNIQNFSANPFRRVDLTATISSAVDHRRGDPLLKERLLQDPERADHAGAGRRRPAVHAGRPGLCVRPYCSNDNYWQVYFDTNRVIRESFDEAGFPAAVPAYAVTGLSAGPPLDATASA